MNADQFAPIRLMKSGASRPLAALIALPSWHVLFPAAAGSWNARVLIRPAAPRHGTGCCEPTRGRFFAYCGLAIQAATRDWHARIAGTRVAPANPTISGHWSAHPLRSRSCRVAGHIRF